MKKSFKIIAVSAAALTFAGCASSGASSSDIADLKVAVEEARAAAVQADQNAQAAYELASQNAEKINRAFRTSQLK
ncbi:hypothetical protein L0B52_01030 [Suttonella sp. R2A3]|uniref:hypothetical protein n=1 Tax=Suttonella sp. R2A3 TaxID=2908648 RepID=UPI001F3FC615|nr:hypothetical protein [Suttonella sp. R2A3]UJF24751.1 hypothetical protein L0B52_01030 [Suttonella sp. R2A3]